MNRMKISALVLLAFFIAACATKPVPKSRQQQVELGTQTGVYSYQRALGPPMGR